MGSGLLFRVRALFRRRAVERELDDELRSHFERQVETYVRSGLSPEQAHRRAALEFGGIEQVKEECRDERGVNLLESLWNDLRFALRLTAKNTGFAAVSILTLALGIGANTGIFTVMHTVLLRAFPTSAPGHLVYLHFDGQPDGSSQTGNGDFELTEPVFQAMRAQKDVFADVVGFAPLNGRSSAVRIDGDPEEAAVELVSGNFFRGLGIQPILGRTLLSEDEAQHSQAAVLSFNYWTSRFARDPQVIGKTIFIKSIPFTIVGVSADFPDVEPSGLLDVFIPFQTAPGLQPWGVPPGSNYHLYGSPDWFFMTMIGRLLPGVTEEAARSRLQPAYQQAVYSGVKPPEPDRPVSRLKFAPVRGVSNAQKDLSEPLSTLMWMVALVLAIACTNVAMLILARNASRQREFVLRITLGARRARLFHQLFVESALFVAAGSALGWLISIWTCRLLAVWAELHTAISPERSAFLLTSAVSVVVTFLFAFLPLRGVSRLSPAMALRTAAASAQTTRSTVRLGRIVVAAQVALCLVLLFGAGLLIRTLRNLSSADLGLRVEGLLTFGIAPPPSVRGDSEAIRFFQSLLQELRALPGVESATLLQNRPGSGWSNNSIATVDGAQPREYVRDSLVRWNVVGPGILHVLGVPILSGRDFNEADSAASSKVVIVNETFVQRYLPGRDALGHHVGIDGPKGTQYTIVGVARNSRYLSVRERDFPVAYFPFPQIPDVGPMQIELRSQGNPEALLPEIRHAVQAFGPDIPLQEPLTQKAQFEASYSDVRLFVRLALVFGALAGLLVATGLYGSLAYRVSGRTAEIGVRMVVGAAPAQILWAVLRESLLVCFVGTLLGIPLALAGARLMRATLYGLTPSDPLALLGALLLILVIAILAGVVPARRAMRVDPIIALRCE